MTQACIDMSTLQDHLSSLRILGGERLCVRIQRPASSVGTVGTVLTTRSCNKCCCGVESSNCLTGQTENDTALSSRGGMIRIERADIAPVDQIQHIQRESAHKDPRDSVAFSGRNEQLDISERHLDPYPRRDCRPLRLAAQGDLSIEVCKELRCVLDWGDGNAIVELD